MAEQLTELETELKKLIMECCKITEPVNDLKSESPLFGPDSPMGLDSLDAVEIIVAIKNKYNIHIGGKDQAYQIVSNLKSLAEYITKQKT